VTNVIVSEDCGNSPKNIFLQDFTIAFAKVDAGFLLDSVTDDIRWDIIGGKHYEGKDDFAAALEKMDEVAEIIIQRVLTHGKAGAVDGLMRTKSGKTIAFCDVVEFGSAKGTRIRKITTYVIEVR
jgi:hypothetical protein